MDDQEKVAVGVVANVMKAIIMELVSDDEEENVLEKTENFFEVTIPNFNDHQFREHFRLERETFERLLQDLYATMPNELQRGRSRMSMEKEILMTLWYLGNCESFRGVACRFGISKSCCWNTVGDVCKKMLRFNQERNIISFPNDREALPIIREFEAINGFPGIVGAIDGCHIEIEKPSTHGNSYINRKGYPSILLQGICDSRKVFLDVYAGEPGSIHDQRLLQKSDVWRRIQDGQIVFAQNSHLIGDLAYRLSEELIVGFKNNGHLTREQIRFNQLLNANRVVIENAFGLLKNRWRRLKRLETKRIDLIPQLVVVACEIQDQIEEDYELNRNALLKRQNIMNVVLFRNNQ